MYGLGFATEQQLHQVNEPKILYEQFSFHFLWIEHQQKSFYVTVFSSMVLVVCLRETRHSSMRVTVMKKNFLLEGRHLRQTLVLAGWLSALTNE